MPRQALSIKSRERSRGAEGRREKESRLRRPAIRRHTGPGDGRGQHRREDQGIRGRIENQAGCKSDRFLVGSQTTKESEEMQRPLAQNKTALDATFAEANRQSGQSNYAEASVEFGKALKIAGELNDADKKKVADEGQRYTSALARAKTAGGLDDQIKSLEEAGDHQA